MKLWYRLTRLLLAAVLSGTLGLGLAASLPSRSSLAAVTPGGLLLAWGSNQFGQLGDGSTTQRNNPIAISLPGGATPIAIASGDAHSLAIGSDGKLYAWGSNGQGEVGDGSTTQRNSPVAISLPNGATPTAISAGGQHNLAIGSDGKLYAWGSNGQGEVGDGSTTQRNSPVQINLSAGVRPTAISAGNTHNLAIGSDGKLYAWGSNFAGRLGDGTTNNAYTPEQINLPNGATPTAIAAGVLHSLAIGSDGKLYAWGYNSNGQLGDGSTTDIYIPEQISLPSGATPTAISAGGYHSLAIGSDGNLYTWGSNIYGQLGDGSTTQRNSPLQISLPNGATPSAIAAGFVHSLAIGSDGKLYTWGYNGFGELGDGSTTQRTTPGPANLPSGATPTVIAAGYYYNLAIATPPNLSVDNVSLAEGNTGTTTFNFTVSLSSPAPLPVTFDIATQDGTATAASGDYTAKSLTAQTIPAGSSSYTFSVLVNGDTTYEQNEIFNVLVTNISGATPLKTTGTGTIVNDDAQPTLSIADTSANEGNAGLTPFNFTVSLSNASSQSLAVNYATSDGTATTADNDYQPATGTLIIPAGQTTGTITVNVNGDTKFEPNETFTVTLSSPTGATLGTASAASGIIINDDGVPTISIGDVSQAEGNNGATAFNFAVTLSAVSAQPVVVQYATADGTATLADNDYAAATGTLTIPAGQTTGTITVLVNGDIKFEPDETFTVNLSLPTGAALGKTTGTGTIVNDDSPPANPAVSVGDVRQREGNSGTTAFNFTVRLSSAAAGPVTVNYATLDDTATVADKDYQPTNGSLTFAPGETAKTVTVLVNGDTKIEPDEVFFLVLTNPTGANLGKGTAQGVILNDDGQVDEADLIGKLRVTPDREFDLDGKGLLTYVLTIKNIGLGASSPPAVQLPIDADFQVAYATFTTDSVPGAFYEKTVTDPVTAVLPYAVLPYAQLRLPALAPGQTVTATVVMRAVGGAKSGELNTRFAIVWNNLDGKPHHYYSNQVHLHLGHGTTRNETDGLVQFLTASADGIGLDEQGRATVQLGGDIYAPGERVYVWYTDANGKSTSLGYVWADLHTGELDTQLVIPGWQSGQRYFLAALGDRSGVIGSATVLVQSRATTQNLTENGSATTSSYSYTQVAPLFNGQALQNLLNGFTFN